MAMRVLTLNKLEDFIENKLGSKQVMLRDNDCVKFVDSKTNDITCYLPLSQITNIDDASPFLKFRDQVSGVLTVCNKVVSDEEIKPYSFLID